MKNVTAALALVCSMTVGTSVKADGPNFTTNFSFEVTVGNNTVTYNSDLTKNIDVVMPSIGWECQRSRVNLTSSGDAYGAGFMCSNDGYRTSTGMKTICAIGKKDYDKGSFVVTGNKVAVMFYVSCTTTAKAVPTNYGTQL